ncbi:hypothetical protein MXD61_17455 [Frankia sp. AgPm24]|uniref:hypothetical protein n=1 Tax=Frankia sp. AgPm24 TaxID=631128 RepID=UPI00200C749A|nr:hypothetical protein [Frankia sp. AgPm24]MCK9923634.1 hypothetical protein [Frankia sp. AgPm24]
MTRDSSATRHGGAATLTGRQAAFLIALLAQRQPISNGELRDRFGFTLVGDDRRRLNDLGLINSSKIRGHGNTLFHEATDAGWARGRRELAPRAEPVRISVPAGLLFALAEGVHRFLDRADQTIGDVLGDHTPTAAEALEQGPDPAAGQPDSDAVPLEAAIRAAYARLAAAPYDWVRLTELRPLLGGAARTQVDQVLRRMARQDDVRVVPDEDRRSLTAGDHAAAVRIGDQDNHLLLIGPA